MPELASSRTPAAPDIVLRLAEVDHAPPEKAILGNGWWATAREICLCCEGLGIVLMRDGREMLVEPAPELKRQAPRSLVLGPALAMLLHQRGLLVLHASAVRMNGVAVAILGSQGWGKSTLAAALHARGHGVLADDVVALVVDGKGTPTVLGASPQLKLWPQVVSALGQDPNFMPRVAHDQDKRAYRAVEGFRREPTALKCVYVLDGGPRIEIEPLGAQDAFVELVRHSYAVHLLDATDTSSRHFQQCAHLARSVPICRLRRQNSLDSLPDLARSIEAHYATQRPLGPVLQYKPNKG